MKQQSFIKSWKFFLIRPQRNCERYKRRWRYKSNRRLTTLLKLTSRITKYVNLPEEILSSLEIFENNGERENGKENNSKNQIQSWLKQNKNILKSYGMERTKRTKKKQETIFENTTKFHPKIISVICNQPRKLQRMPKSLEIPERMVWSFVLNRADTQVIFCS